jgi:hypothetical protein
VGQSKKTAFVRSSTIRNRRRNVDSAGASATPNTIASPASIRLWLIRREEIEPLFFPESESRPCSLVPLHLPAARLLAASIQMVLPSTSYFTAK